MYKVFIHNCPLFISSKTNFKHPDIHISGGDHRLEIASEIHRMALSKKLRELYIIDDPMLFVQALWSFFDRIDAAGGMVWNQKDELLMIHRLGHWDLPKGKVEENEEWEEAAQREIEEECGLTGLKLKSELSKTYHSYTLKGKEILKVTHWYSYSYAGPEELVPQEEEGIEEVLWLNKDEVTKRRELIYPSLYQLLEE